MMNQVGEGGKRWDVAALKRLPKHVSFTSTIMTGSDAMAGPAFGHFLRSGIVATALALALSPAASQEFYAGKTMTIVVGYAAGSSGYDTNARFVARNLPRFLPGAPTIIVQNMIGAGTLAAANHVANVAPKDGTVLAFVARGMGIEPLLGGENVRYDPLKLNWIGSSSREVSIIAVRSDAGINSLDDVKQREVAVAAIAAGTDGVTFPLALNNLIGTKFKTIMGYKNGGEMTLAMMRGEVQGRGSWSWASFRSEASDLLTSGQVKILVQMATTKAAELPDTPLVTDLVKGEEERQILEILLAGQNMAWPMFAAAEAPAERVAAIRKAYLDMFRDPDVAAEARKQGLDVDPVSGEEIQHFLTRLYATPKETVMRARQLAGR
jgi:tripartite-type tricarboxylate transporter receptor subunit TctC